EFALQNILRAAVVETEYFIVQVQAGNHQCEALRKRDAALRVHLKVGIKVGVAERSLNAKAGAVGVLILENALIVVGHANANGDAATVVSGADVKGMRRLTLQRRMIGAADVLQAKSARLGVAVVGGKAEAVEGTRQSAEMLEV